MATLASFSIFGPNSKGKNFPRLIFLVPLLLMLIPIVVFLFFKANILGESEWELLAILPHFHLLLCGTDSHIWLPVYHFVRPSAVKERSRVQRTPMPGQSPRAG